MSKFKVIEIIDAATIRVYPKWFWSDEIDAEKQESGDLVKIIGLENKSLNNEYFTAILTSILKDREVELVNPKAERKSDNSIEVACDVIIDGTDLMYYFSLVNPKTKKREFAYQ